MKNIIMIAMGIGLAFFLSACGGSSSESRTNTYLVIENDVYSYEPIVDVYIANAEYDDWGSDELNGQIAPGESKKFSVTTCDIYYKVQVVFADSYDVEGMVYLPCGQTKHVIVED